mgnify:CR=1 FL=1
MVAGGAVAVLVGADGVDGAAGRREVGEDPEVAVVLVDLAEVLARRRTIEGIVGAPGEVVIASACSLEEAHRPSLRRGEAARACRGSTP